MFPYGWFIIFSVSTLAFFYINSSWSSFFSSPLMLKEKEEMCFSEIKDFWL